MKVTHYIGENEADPVLICDIHKGESFDIHLWATNGTPEDSSYWYHWDGKQWHGDKNADDNVFITQPSFEGEMVRISANLPINYVAQKITV